jgi:hypothetical protein
MRSNDRSHNGFESSNSAILIAMRKMRHFEFLLSFQNSPPAENDLTILRAPDVLEIDHDRKNSSPIHFSIFDRNSKNEAF